MADESPIFKPLFRIDPGWLFILSGAALLASIAVIPAQDDLRLAHQARDRAIALESHRARRLENYARYLTALSTRDETLMKALAAGQLNLAPADKMALINSTEVVNRGAGVFADLEPPFEPPAPIPAPDSLLHKLATNATARMWVIVVGAVAVLYGLLPASDQRARRPRDTRPAAPEMLGHPRGPAASL